MDENDPTTQAQVRKRRPGAGRKPTGRTVIAKQVCLTPRLWEMIEARAKACGQSRSAWLAEAADCLWRKQVWQQH